MTPLKRNLSRFFIFFLVLILSATIFGFVYFFKMEHNEDTLNTLYFRELQRIEGGIQRSIQKVSATSDFSLSVKNKEKWRAPSILEKELEVQAKLNFDKLAASANELSDIAVHKPKVYYQNCDVKISRFTLRIPRYDTVKFYKEVCLQSHKIARLELTASIHDVLSQRVDRFQMVALVEGRGEVRAITNNSAKLSNEPELYFKSILPKLFSSDAINTKNAIVLKGTHFSDINLDRNAYRAFVHPIISKGLTENSKNYFLIGLVNKEVITTEKLKLPSEVLMWLILALLFFIACTPLLKLRFISATYAIQQGDKSQIVLGFLVAVGILTIGISQQLFQGYQVAVKRDQLRAIHQTITAGITRELTNITNVQKIGCARKNNEKCDSPAFCAANDKQPFPYYIEHGWNKNFSALPLAENSSYIETALYLNKDGGVETSEFHEPRYASNALVPEVQPNLAHRRYFKEGKKGDFWLFNGSNLYMQRIFNIEDGRQNLIFAFPHRHDKSQRESKTCLVKEDKAKAGNDSVALEVLGARMTTLVDRVLPKNFRFVVINESGDVVFHSTDSLSLVENFYTEINQDPLALVANTHNSASVIEVNADYKGIPHNMTIGPLTSEPDSSTIPWKLVVFFNPSDMHMNNMVLVFTAVLLFLALIIPTFIVCRFLLTQKFWQEIFYFDKTQNPNNYRVFSVFTIALIVFVLLQMGVVHSVVARLTVWALACLLLVFFVIKLWSLNYSMYFRWHRPISVVSAIVIPLVLLSLFVSWRKNYDTESVNYVSAVLGIVSLIIATLLLVDRLIKSTFFEPNHGVQCSQEKDNDKASKNKTVQSTRYSNAYLVFLTSLIYIASAVPASIITYSAHEYLLERQAYFEEDFLNDELARKTTELQRYLRTITDDESITIRSKLPNNIDLLFNSFVVLNQNNTSEIPQTESEKQAWFRVNPTQFPSSDKLFDLLFSSAFEGTDFISHLTYEAKIAMNVTEKATKNLHYRGDHFMLSAISPSYMLMMLLFPIGIYFVSRQFIVQRLLGEHLQNQYRTREQEDEYCHYETCFPNFMADNPKEGLRSKLVLNTSRLCAQVKLNELKEEEGVLYEQQVFRIMDCLDKFYSSSEHIEKFYFLEKLGRFLANNKKQKVIVAISALEQISLDSSLRKDALAFLYEMHVNRNVTLVIVAETAPLYRIICPNAYQPTSNLVVDIDEKTGWTKLFSEFDKYYAWSPVFKKRISNPFDVNVLLKHELHAWPELETLKAKYQETSLQEPEQVIEFVLVHAGPIYRRKWEECTVNEKVILWRMAHGANINPESSATIERLVRRCYLYRDKGWHLINESFRQFILTAEPESVMKEWLDNTNLGFWSVLRVPVFALLFVLIAVFIYSSGSSLDTFLGIATATLGLIPLLIKNLSLLRGGALTDVE
ncbi:hypothetical protein ACV4QK_06090 [Alteromonas macleodii]